MKKIFIVFMVILLLCLTIVPSFAAYSASVDVVDNDSDTGEVSAVFQSANLLDINPDSTYTDITATNISDYFDLEPYTILRGTAINQYNRASFVTDSSISFDYGSITFIGSAGYGMGIFLGLGDDNSYYISCSNLNSGGTFLFYVKYYDLDGTYVSYHQYSSASFVTLSSSYYYILVCYRAYTISSDLYTTYSDLVISPVEVSYHQYFNTYVLLDDLLDVQSDLYTPLAFVQFSNDGINNRGVYVQAFSDSDLTTDITSDVATSSGLTVDSDGLIYLEFEDGVTDQLYYDGTVYYQVTLDPSPPYMFVNLYRHIFENFAGTYTFLTEDNWIFITCVSSIAICFVIFVGVFFFKRFSH